MQPCVRLLSRCFQSALGLEPPAVADAREGELRPARVRPFRQTGFGGQAAPVPDTARRCNRAGPDPGPPRRGRPPTPGPHRGPRLPTRPDHLAALVAHLDPSGTRTRDLHFTRVSHLRGPTVWKYASADRRGRRPHGGAGQTRPRRGRLRRRRATDGRPGIGQATESGTTPWCWTSCCPASRVRGVPLCPRSRVLLPRC
jgi:hypothetical protein